MLYYMLNEPGDITRIQPSKRKALLGQHVQRSGPRPIVDQYQFRFRAPDQLLC